MQSHMFGADKAKSKGQINRNDLGLCQTLGNKRLCLRCFAESNITLIISRSI